MRLDRGLVILLSLCLLAVASPGWAQTATGGVAVARPSIMLSATRLERLKVLSKGQSPQWRRLMIWALEPGRQGADHQDGPGLALAALVGKHLDPKQAAILGRQAVACALAGAPLGKTQGVSRHQLTDTSRMGGVEKLQEAGYVLVNPQLGQERHWRVQRYSPNGVMVEANEPSLQEVAKVGQPYALLMEDVLKANKVVGEVALTLDWAWEWFTADQRQAVASWLVAQAKVFSGHTGGCFDRAATAALRLVGLAGMAAQGLHPEALALMDQARQTRFEKEILPCLNGAGQGGAWFEGSFAGAAAGLDLLEYVAAVKSVSGEDLLGKAPWFADRLAYLAHHTLPGAAITPRGGYRRIMPDGDQVMSEEDASDLVRLQMLVLADLAPRDPAAGWAWALVQDRRTPRVLADRYLGLEFLWLEPDASAATWSAIPLSHAAQGTGRVMSRSEWSELSTWVGFSCGPHFGAGRHLDAGSLLIFRQGMLLGRAGVFDGPASPQRLNYAMRTLAQNTVVVNDPQEYSWYDLGDGTHKRGTYANDGGQRALSLFDDKGQPTRTAPLTASGWETGPAPWTKNRDIYGVATLEAFEDQPRFSYMRGMATPAYQGSTHKVTRFLRHVFHLRPGGREDAEAAEAVVVMDDLEVARSELQGRLALHFPSRPETVGQLAAVGPGRWRGDLAGLTIRNENSRLDVATLLPADAQLNLFGEAGVADSWVGERNHPPRPPAINPMPWRAEIGPGKARGLRQPMVQALMPAALEAPASPVPTALATDDPQVVGLVIADKRWPRWVALRLGQPRAESVVSYAFNGGDSRHLVAGLAPKTSYSVTVKDGKVVVAPGTGLVSSNAGLLAFKLTRAPVSD